MSRGGCVELSVRVGRASRRTRRACLPRRRSRTNAGDLFARASAGREARVEAASGQREMGRLSGYARSRVVWPPFGAAARTDRRGRREDHAIDSLTAQKRLVQAGFGLALVPESSVRDELKLGSLKELEIPALRASIPVALIHRRDGYLNPAARALIALMSEKSLRLGERGSAG